MPQIAWIRGYPAVCTAGDVGGDVQISEAYNARWSKPLSDGQWAVVVRTFYTAENGRAYLERLDEYIRCADPADPGSTEIWADYRYRRPGGRGDPRLAAEAAPAPTDAEWDEVANYTEVTR